MTTQNFDMSYSPSSYLENLTLEEKLRANIKGQLRAEYVTKNIRYKTMNPQMLKSELGTPLKTERSKLHPWMMGGEYLPDLNFNEVEICRIVLKSTTMDVVSLRALMAEELINYSVVDEYGESDYVLKFQKLDTPLTMGQLVENIDHCVEIHKDSGAVNDYGGGGLVKPWVYQQFESGDSLEEAADFISVYSAFYPELEGYYEHQKPIWFKEM